MPALEDFTLDHAFWKGFFSRHWGVKPLVIETPFSRPVITADEITQALPGALGRLKKDPGAQCHIQVGDRQLTSDEYAPWFPKADAGSFEAYMAGVERRLKGTGSRFAASVGDIYVDTGWKSWNRIRAFMKGFNDAGNFPLSFASIHVFWGNNPVSFSGVHRDIFDVFCFILSGKKRIRLWPAEYFQIPFQSRFFEYKKFLKDSVVLEGGPGDILYWPKSYWHVGEIDEGSAASISLLMAASGGLSRVGNLELRSASAFFKIFGRHPQGAFGLDEEIRGDALLPILYERNGDVGRIASAGHSIEVPFFSGLPEIIGDLNSGKPVRVGAILEKGENPEIVSSLLGSLASFGAFSREL